MTSTTQHHNPEGTMTAQTDTTPAPKRIRKPKVAPGAPQRPTITNAEHQGLLDIRRDAMHLFETTPETDKNFPAIKDAKNKARRAVANSRKIRNSEAEVLDTWNAWEASEAERIQAEKDAKPKRTRAAKKTEQVPGQPLVEVEAPELTVTEAENGEVKVEVAA